MKILIIKTFPGEIKTKKITYNLQEIGLAKSLIRKGHKCDIMCCADGKPRVSNFVFGENQTIKIYAVKSRTILKNGFLKDADNILKQYDILHMSEYNQLYTWHLSKKYSDKAIIYHGPYYSAFNKKYNLMAKIFDMFFVDRYRKLNTFFITKSILAEKYLKKKNLKNVTTVGVGIDEEMLSCNKSDKCNFYYRLSDFDHKFKMLYVGKIEKRRNTLFIIDILKKLVDNGLDVGLVLIGKGCNYRDEVFEKIKKLNLENNVLYEETLEQKFLKKVYEKCDLFLLPTYYEIYGMVLLEAMYFGLPTVTTLNGGSSMLINDSFNGFICPNDDLNKWASIIRDIYENKYDLKTISKNASDTIKNDFTWDSLADKFIALYNKKLK